MVRVSVIIPNYNHAAYLKTRIVSVLNQTYQNFEILILDDCSTDNSKEVIEEFKGHIKISHIIFNDKNSGSTFKQWEKGIDLAKGELIWIAESDDYCEPNFLEVLQEKFTEDDSLGIVYCQSMIIDENDIKNGVYQYTSEDRWQNGFKNQGSKECRKSFLTQNIIPNASAAIIKKEYLKVIHSFPISFRLNGDWFLYINVLLHANIQFVSQPLNYYRKHSGTVRSSNRIPGYDIYEKTTINDFLIKNFDLSFNEKIKILKKIYDLWNPNKTTINDEINAKINQILKLHTPYNYISNFLTEAETRYSRFRISLGGLKKRIINNG